MRKDTAALGELETLLLLAVLHLAEQHEDAYGSAIREAVEARTPRRVPRGSLYITLDRLEEKGLLASRNAGTSAVRGHRPKRVFKVTAAGVAAVRAAVSAVARMRRGLEDVLGRRLMGNLLWRVCEWRIRRVVPPWHAASTIGDLAEDYGRARVARGGAASALWLIRESASLTRAYRAGREPRPLMLADDLRHAWRRLAARPAAALLCAALLSIGIGLATAMFSVADALILQPAPFPNADRLVQQGLFRPEPAVMEAWRASGLFDAVEAGRISSFQHDGGAWPGALVTPGTFTMLGTTPLRGRGLLDHDAHPGADGVIVVSETIWRSVFAGDPGLVGRCITLSGTPQLVVGIMPDTFRFPAPETVVWGPFDPARAAPSLTTVFARLTPGVPLSTAAARAAAIARQSAYLPLRYSGTPPFRRIGAIDLGAFTRNAIWLLFAGVGLVFVVVCSNVGGLLLAHLASRRREFGTCAALGASRGRLVRQALTEHAVVATIGTAAGVGLAWMLTVRVPEFFLGRTLNVIDLDMRALATASILGVASVLLSGLAPAWLGTRCDPVHALRQLSSTGTESRAARVATRSLLVAQIGLAVSLLIGAAVLTRSFSNLVNADRGLNTASVVRISLSGLDRAFTSPRAMALRTAAIEAQAAVWPEIRELALSREVPPSLSSTALVQGALQADEYRVGSTFFEFYGVPIRRGRAFENGDADLEVIVGERLAQLVWPDADPLGRSLLIGRTARTVIGVAGEIALPTVARDLDRPEFYVPLGNTSRTLFLNVRCRAACPDAGVIRARLAAIHPALSARVVGPSEIEYVNHLKLPRAVAQVGGLFALVAVTAAAGGLFSVMAQVVGRRKREFGIRTALGASRRNVRWLVLADALPLVAAGLALGGAGGWLVARGLAAFNYGVPTFDPQAWAGVSATIGMSVLAAAWRPAREAMRVDPVTLLREE